MEDEEEVRAGDLTQQISDSKDTYESEVGGLDESRWETSPTRGVGIGPEEEEAGVVAATGGVLGLLYQFQKAQTDRPGVNI